MLDSLSHVAIEACIEHHFKGAEHCNITISDISIYLFIV